LAIANQLILTGCGQASLSPLTAEAQQAANVDLIQ
jgi:hypothetical protein